MATISLDEWISLAATQYVLEPMLRARYMAVAAREIAPQRRWSRAKTGEGQVVLLFGEAGIGKSRLTAANRAS